MKNKNKIIMTRFENNCLVHTNFDISEREFKELKEVIETFEGVELFLKLSRYTYQIYFGLVFVDDENIDDLSMKIERIILEFVDNKNIYYRIKYYEQRVYYICTNFKISDTIMSEIKNVRGIQDVWLRTRHLVGFSEDKYTLFFEIGEMFISEINTIEKDIKKIIDKYYC